MLRAAGLPVRENHQDFRGGSNDNPSVKFEGEFTHDLNNAALLPGGLSQAITDLNKKLEAARTQAQRREMKVNAALELKSMQGNHQCACGETFPSLMKLTRHQLEKGH